MKLRTDKFWLMRILVDTLMFRLGIIMSISSNSRHIYETENKNKRFIYNRSAMKKKSIYVNQIGSHIRDKL